MSSLLLQVIILSIKSALYKIFLTLFELIFKKTLKACFMCMKK
jgi:hypothetical protein